MSVSKDELRKVIKSLFPSTELEYKTKKLVRIVKSMAQKRKNVGLCILLESLCSLRTPKKNLEEELLNACPDMKDVEFWVDAIQEIGLDNDPEYIRSLPVYKLAEEYDELYPPKSSLDGYFRKKKILKPKLSSKKKSGVTFVPDQVILFEPIKAPAGKISDPLVNRDEEFSGWSL